LLEQFFEQQELATAHDDEMEQLAAIWQAEHRGFHLRFAIGTIYDGAIKSNRECGGGDRYCEVVQCD
jgi:hypothetical protein